MLVWQCCLQKLQTPNHITTCLGIDSFVFFLSSSSFLHAVLFFFWVFGFKFMAIIMLLTKQQTQSSKGTYRVKFLAGTKI